jgi:hypothetical protein
MAEISARCSTEVLILLISKTREHPQAASLLLQKGYMGLVPVLREVSDVVVILHGAKTPHLLRSCPQTTNAGGVTYRLVGEAYMHGLIRGHLEIPYGYPQQEFLLV